MQSLHSNEIPIYSPLICTHSLRFNREESAQFSLSHTHWTPTSEQVCLFVWISYFKCGAHLHAYWNVIDNQLFLRDKWTASAERAKIHGLHYAFSKYVRIFSNSHEMCGLDWACVCSRCLRASNAFPQCAVTSVVFITNVSSKSTHCLIIMKNRAHRRHTIPTADFFSPTH